MPRPSPFISKSKYLSGLQCEKLLWHYYNAKSKIPPPDAGTQAIFNQGHQVGELAKQLFPGGIEIAKNIFGDFNAIEQQSVEGLKSRKPLFEAGFRFGHGFARADILNPVGRDQWDIIEVKSSTEVKDVNVRDMALQRYVYEGAGMRIRKCFILHINNQYIRRGPVEPEELFSHVEITDDAAKFIPQVAGDLEKMIGVIALKTFSRVPIGPHCSDPYSCPLTEMCWSFLPEDNVLTLYYGGKKGWELLGEGIEKITDIPAAYELSDRQVIQLDALRTGKPVYDATELTAFLVGLKYPIYYLDFETISTAVPLYDEVRPYQQIPFQYSLHVVASAGAKPMHFSFLADGKSDPRPELLGNLKTLLGGKGSIVAYNASFEKGRLSDACTSFPEFQKWYEEIEPRFVDLLAPFRSFHYYHPAQHGSASIKTVYPALAGKGYGGLAISDGGMATLEYLRVTFGEVAAEERARVRKNLEEYCATDTRAMMEIVEALEKITA